MFVRPCLLVIDAEHANSISSRKLVLETSKYNVITAYSCREAVSTLDRFPAVDALVMNGVITQEPGFDQLADAIERHPNVRVLVVGDSLRVPVEFRIDTQVESFAPAQLLAAVHQAFPMEARALVERDNRLEDEGQ